MFCAGLFLVLAYNLLLVLYTKATLQALLLRSFQKELRLSLSEWNGTVIRRLSHLELDLRHLSKFLTVMWRGWCVCACACSETLRKKGVEEKNGQEVMCSSLHFNFSN